MLADFVDVIHHIKYKKYKQPENYTTHSYTEIREAFITIKETFRNPTVTIGDDDAYSVVAVADQSKNPVIAFGGSYGGTLAAWMRMKYPAVVEGLVKSTCFHLQA